MSAQPIPKPVVELLQLVNRIELAQKVYPRTCEECGKPCEFYVCVACDQEYADRQSDLDDFREEMEG